MSFEFCHMIYFQHWPLPRALMSYFLSVPKKHPVLSYTNHKQSLCWCFSHLSSSLRLCLLLLCLFFPFYLFKVIFASLCLSVPRSGSTALRHFMEPCLIYIYSKYFDQSIYLQNSSDIYFDLRVVHERCFLMKCVDENSRI